MKRPDLTREEADSLVSELRRMALLPAGTDEQALGRSSEICRLLNGLPAARPVARASATAHGLLEILLSHRRWKTEASSIEALRRDIKSACDRLRVAVEAGFRPAGPGT